MDINALIMARRFPPLEYRAISQVAYDQARALVGRGARVTVITQNDKNWNEVENHEGMCIHRVGAPDYRASSWEMEPLIWGPIYLKHIYTSLSLRQFDVIHAHGIDFALALQLLAEVCNVPILPQFHVCFRARADIGDVHFNLELAHYYQYYVAQRAAAVIAVSKSDKHSLGTFLNCANKTVIVPNGLNLEMYPRSALGRADARAQFKLGDEFAVLWGGRVGDFMKGPDIVGKAFSVLAGTRKAAILLVAVVQNDPPENLGTLFSNLSDEARKRTAVHYPRDKQELLTLFAASDVFIMPSRYEPFGLMALEAMASGLPVIVSPRDGLDELVDHERTGLKIHWGNITESADSLASKLGLLMENPELAKLLGGSARASVNRFDIGRVADRLLEVYRAVKTGEQITEGRC